MILPQAPSYLHTWILLLRNLETELSPTNRRVNFYCFIIKHDSFVICFFKKKNSYFMWNLWFLGCCVYLVFIVPFSWLEKKRVSQLPSMSSCASSTLVLGFPICHLYLVCFCLCTYTWILIPSEKLIFYITLDFKSSKNPPKCWLKGIKISLMLIL